MDALRLEIAHLTAKYGTRTILHDISLSLCQGQVLVVSGSNGSGKSTLLRLLCGLQRPTSGSMVYHKDGAAFTPDEAQHLVGWVAPDLSLYRELTARENLRFFATVRGLHLNDTRIDELLARVGLHARGDDRVAFYSSGMTHRLRYAYALLHQPAVLLLDEPTVTLDERGTAQVNQIIADQRTVGMTILATNDPRELRFGDYVLTLHNELV